jgi:hypothetical protein
VPSPIQRPDEAAALTQALDLSGKVGLLLDDVMVPVVISEDLTDTPFQRTNPGIRNQTTGPQGAGIHSMVGVAPAENTILGVKRVFVYNSDSAGNHTIFLKFLTPAQVATITTIVTEQIYATIRPLTRAGAQRLLASTIFQASHTGLIGATLHHFDIPADGHVDLSFPQRIYLDGANGGALLAQSADANHSLVAGFDVMEYTAPRQQTG